MRILCVMHECIHVSAHVPRKQNAWLLIGFVDNRLNGASRRGDSIVLTIDGDNWKLDGDHTLHEVTHLPCRSAAYTGCSPKSIDMNNFPVTPGACMPEVTGCRKTDYAVLFVNAIEDPGANFSPKSRAALKNAIGSCV